MTGARASRLRRLVLVLALVGALGLAGAVGFVAWRRTRPLWTFEKSSLGGAPWFLDSGRAIALRSANANGDSLRGHVLSLETGAELSVLPDDFLDFSRGTGRVLRGSRGKPLVLGDPVSGTRRIILETLDAVSPLAFSPDDDRLVCVPINPYRNTLEIRSPAPESSRAVVVSGAERFYAERAVFSPAGDRLAVEWSGPEARDGLTRGPRICVYGTSTGALETDVAGRYLLGFSSGSELVTLEWTGRGRSIRARRGAGIERTLVLAEVAAETLSASGLRLATCEGLLSSGEEGARRVFVVRDVSTGAIVCERRLRELPQAGPVVCLALSAEGDRLAVAYEKGTVDVWELPPP